MDIETILIYLTQDIKDIKTKTWIKPALISHIAHNTGKPEKLIAIAVDTYFNNQLSPVKSFEPEKYILKNFNFERLENLKVSFHRTLSIYCCLTTTHQK